METIAPMDVAAMVASATVMVKAVMILLLAMSIWSWSIIMWKLFTLIRASKAASRGLKAFAQAPDIASGLLAVDGCGHSPVLQAARQAAQAMAGDSGPAGPRLLSRALRLSGTQRINELSRSIGFLAATASSAPFIGLFGTVWGIMHAFSSLGKSANVTLAMVAPGIAEALVTTAMGLFTAIPAVLAFNAFTGILDRLDDDLDDFIQSLLDKALSSRPGTRG